jgi:hypothetical protein
LEELRHQEGQTASVAALESTQKRVMETQEAINAYKEVLLAQASNVINFWGGRIMDFYVGTEMTFLQYHGFTWPTAVIAESFYIFAVLLIPISKWDTQIRSDSSIRHMHQTFIKAEKKAVETPEDLYNLDQQLLTVVVISSKMRRSVQSL